MCPPSEHQNGLLPLPQLVDKRDKWIMVLLLLRHGRSTGLLDKLIMGAVEALPDKLNKEINCVDKIK